MLKKGILLVFLLLLIPCTVFAETPNLNVKCRVGLEYKYKNVTSIPIANTDIIVGVQYGNEFFSLATISSNDSSPFSVSVTGLYYVQLGKDYYRTYNEAVAAAANYSARGNEASVALVSGMQWAVYSKGYQTQTEANSVANVLGGTVLIQTGKRCVLVSKNKTYVVFENSDSYAQIKPTATTLTIDDRSYRGAIELYTLNNKLTAINVLSLDEYLYGVVPSEMPSTWNIEALKAQAVAARTYALTYSNSHIASGYELCDAVHCQVYKGAGAEAQSTNDAVDQTSGVVIYYNDVPINATFFASSGGITENSEGIWENTLPYLRSVTEIAESADVSWSHSFTLANLTTLLNVNGINIGSATGMNILSYTASGRVEQLQITATAGTKVLKKGEIRSFFAHIAYLESTNFQIVSGSTVLNEFVVLKDATSAAQKAVNGLSVISAGDAVKNNVNTTITVLGASGAKNYEPTKTVTSSSSNEILIIGRGKGHGVGMSQIGAKGMAELGYSYIDILKHYYTGVVVK